MPRMRYLVPCVLLVAVLFLLLKQRGNRSAVPSNQTSAPASSRAPVTNAPVRNVVNTPTPAPGSDEAVHAEAVAVMQQWASAAKPYNWNSTVTNYSDVKHPKTGKIASVTMETPTFFVVVEMRHDGAMVSDAASHFDTSRTPEDRTTWHQAVGTWTEREAVAETRAILERLGETQTLAKVVRAPYEQPTLPIAAPGGKPVPLTPFADVRLYGSNDRLYAQAEYRMTASGPGLVKWFYWPDVRK